MMRTGLAFISFALVRSNQSGSEEHESTKKTAWHHRHHHHHHPHHHEWQDWVRDESNPLPPAAREAQEAEHHGKKIALSDARSPMTYELELSHVVMDQDGNAHEATAAQKHAVQKQQAAGDDNPNPACSWHCSNPICEESCQPVCSKPICKTFCQPLKMASCTTVCGDPVCHVICPTGSAGKRSADCTTTCGPPQCETKCQRQCESVCGKPSCQLECTKPKTCPKPTCQMVCSGPAVNSVPDQAEVPEGKGIEVASGEAQLGSICPPGCMRAPAPGAPGAGPNATGVPPSPVAMAFIQEGVRYTKIGNKFWPCPANCVSTPALVQLMTPGAANATMAL